MLARFVQWQAGVRAPAGGLVEVASLADGAIAMHAPRPWVARGQGLTTTLKYHRFPGDLPVRLPAGDALGPGLRHFGGVGGRPPGKVGYIQQTLAVAMTGKEEWYLAATDIARLGAEGAALEVAIKTASDPLDTALARVGLARQPQAFLYLSPFGSQTTPLHFDPTAVALFVVEGEKRVDLYPPYGLPPGVEPEGGWADAAFCWRHNVLPAVYAAGRPTMGTASERCHLHAGDVLGIPPGWWHAVAGGDEANAAAVCYYLAE